MPDGYSTFIAAYTVGIATLCLSLYRGRKALGAGGGGRWWEILQAGIILLVTSNLVLSLSQFYIF